jgi:hypothetical protein
MTFPRSKRRVLAYLGVLAATVLLGWGLQQRIAKDSGQGTNSGQGMTWVMGRIGATHPNVIISGSSWVFRGRQFRCFKLVESPNSPSSHGWMLFCGWFYVGWHDSGAVVF